MRNHLPHIVLLVCVASAGCETAAPVSDESSPERDGVPEITGQPIAVPSQYEFGCSPIEDTSAIRGTVRAVPFGKGADGVIVDDGETKWVVSYDATGFFADFEDESVLVRGRECEPSGAAVTATHFDVQSLRVIE